MSEVLKHPPERRCPACGSESHHARGQKNGFEMFSCQKCGTLYTSAFPDSDSEQDYNEYYGEGNLSVPDFINQRLDEIMASFAAYRENGRLLDVGFGAGTILEAAARAGWTASGVEVSETAVEHVRALGYDVFCGELAEARYADDYFDVVTASEVLEHVPDPRAMLDEIARILRPGGLLWATTPHGKGLSSRILGLQWSTISPPEHLHLFSLRGLKALLRASNFRRIRVATHGVNPFEIWHSLRPHQNSGAAAAEADGENFSRVASSYQLNQFLTGSGPRRVLKGAANGLLSAGRLGDSLKIWAEK
jgi:SAM-dependent methyltransferase